MAKFEHRSSQQFILYLSSNDPQAELAEIGPDKVESTVDPSSNTIELGETVTLTIESVADGLFGSSEYYSQYTLYK